MAAAAIASGALGPLGVGDGLLVDGGATATATGVGVVASRPTCWTRRTVGSTPVGSADACASSGFCPVDLAAVEEDDEVVSVDWLVLPLAWPHALALLAPLLAALFDGSLPPAVLLESALVGGAEALLLLAGEYWAGGRETGGAAWEAGGAGGAGGGGAGGRGWSPGVFWWTSDLKMSFAADASGRVSQEGAAWNAALAATSGGTLTTGRSPVGTGFWSARTGPLRPSVNSSIFQSLNEMFGTWVRRENAVFSAQRQVLPPPGAVIASREYGLY